MVQWFEKGNRVEIADNMPFAAFERELDRVDGLRALALAHLKIPAGSREQAASGMEFVLDALHQCSKIAKDEVDRSTAYKDMLGSIFTARGDELSDEEDQ